MGSGKKKKAEDITRPLKEIPELEKRVQEFPKKGTLTPGNAIALLDAVAAISEPLEVHRVAEEAALQIVVFSNADICAISRWNAKENIISLWAEYHRGQSHAASIPYLPYHASDYPITEKVLQSAAPLQIRISDPTLDEGERVLMKGVGAKSLLMLPLMAEEKTIGLIEVFETTHDRVYTQEEVANILVLAKHAGISLERARLLGEAKLRAAELEVIRRASLNLTASLDKEKVFNAILKSALMLSPDALDAHIFTYQNDDLTFGSSLWAHGKKGPAWEKTRKGGLTESVATSGKIIAVEDVSNHPFYKNTQWVKEGWKGSIIGLPLKTGEKVVGVMNIAYKTRQEFTEDRLHLLGLLTDQAAIAIMNARFHDLVRRQAITDTLTGLPNRRAFNDRLDEEIRRSNRYHHPFSLLMIDLDGFKKVNDNFGHPTGDLTLQVVANCLQRAVRDTDFIARYGGDEFTLILPETLKSQAQVLKAKIAEAISRCKMPWENGQQGLKITLSLSVGVSCYPEDAKNAEGLIANADKDLYSRKNWKKPDSPG